MDQSFSTASPADDAAEEARIEKLQAFADVLAEKRKEAVEFKQQSGVEQEIQEDEDFYEGIDDANREDVKWLKSASLNGTPSTAEAPKKSTKSNIFTNITETYVDMAAASVADMLLPTDDMPFALLPTPEPDLEDALDEKGVLTGPNGQQMPVADAAQAMLDEAAKSAEKAQTRIWDWLTDAHWHTEGRKLINEAARIGTSVLKGPYPIKQKSKKIEVVNGVARITMVQKLKPASKQISVKDLFPDPSCGENIHKGSYVWERDRITARALKDLKGMVDQDGRPQYLDSQIDSILKEGPGKKYDEKGRPDDSAKAALEEYEIWYYHGSANSEALQAAGCKCQEGADIPVMVTMVNDRVIKASLSTTDSGSFPYDVLRWKRVAGRWTGKSEARKIRTAQRILVGAVRSMMNNAGLASGPQIVIDAESLTPADGDWRITPNKIWKKIIGAPITDVAKAITSIKIDSMQEELMNIVKFALELADKCATMPIQQQGQQGVTQETAEGRRLLQNNASVQKRALAKIFDDDITEPHIERYYEWLLLDPNCDASMKREFVIDARGSTALYERDAENMVISQVGAFVKDPAFGLSPRKWMKEYLKSNKISPERLENTEAEQKQIDDAASKAQPQAPAVAAAQIREDGAAKRQQAELAAKAQESEKDRQMDLIVQQMLEHVTAMKLEGDKEISFDDLKAELANTVLKLRTQDKLSARDAALDLHKHHVPAAPDPNRPVLTPPTEPKGRAQPGQAFEQ